MGSDTGPRENMLMAALEVHPLSVGRWKEVETDRDVNIPTDIFLDLQNAGKIPDPFLGMNEKKVQWIMDSDFTFTAPLPQQPSTTGLNRGERAVLVFEGLDTFATVYIGEQQILRSDNMFISHRVDITPHYQQACSSGITIVFESAKKRGDERLAKYGKRVCWNGHYSRVYVRKAQYHYVSPTFFFFKRNFLYRKTQTEKTVGLGLGVGRRYDGMTRMFR